MAAPLGHTPVTLIERLAQEPYRFDFFQAVRLLENHYREYPPIGHSVALAQDPIRFGENPSLIFAPATLESFVPAADGKPPKLVVRFFGLYGPHGPMPLHFTEYAQQRQENFKDPTLARFLDIFHHRLISLFYRAWASSQKTVDLDRPDRADRLSHQLFAIFIGSLFGIGMDSLAHRDLVPDWAKLYFAGRLSAQTRNAEGLQAILRTFFNVPVEILTFIGQWIKLPEPSICRLGESTATGKLGVSVVVGSHFWECQMKFRIRLGPMSLADYERLLPRGESFARLTCWVLNYVGQELSWEAQLVLQAEEVPAIRLGGAGQLGWTTWLRTGPYQRDADDLVLLAT